jgi:DNA-binding response OmpR family regulator
MKLKDEPSIRKYLQSVLEANGYHVETVSNDKDAIFNCRASILPKTNSPSGLRNTGTG